MDYLDPRKQLRQRFILPLGYVLIGVAIILATWLLVAVAQGFGRGKNGAVIQNGLAFFSSQPSPAGIYVNGASKPLKTTNTRLYLPEGTYAIQLKRTGYRTWQRTVVLNGGSVEHFDYPLLFPTTMTAKPVQTYASAPQLSTQSPDRRWLVVSQPGSLTDFDVYDLKSNTPATTLSKLSLPAGLLTKASNPASESWQLEEWADDNQHLVLQHNYDGKTEYILIDRTDATKAQNLNTVLSLSPTDPIKLTLDNKKYDQYYIYDSATTGTAAGTTTTSTTGTTTLPATTTAAGSASTLQTASLKTPAQVPLLDHVLSYQTYGSNTVIYVTDSGAPAGKVEVKLLQGGPGGKIYDIRTLPAGTIYLLDLATYNGTPYLAVGASSDNKVYIYQDPISHLTAEPAATTPSTAQPTSAATQAGSTTKSSSTAPSSQTAPTTPTALANPDLDSIQILHVTAPNYLSFSDNAQFIMTENAGEFAVYDIENKQLYHYTIPQPLDAPQIHASWMDGDRLTYVSGGKLIVFDYDAANRQTLIPAAAQYLPAFTPDYKNLFTLAPAPIAPTTTADQFDLSQTSLLTPADQ
jgi:hypothetical protein